MNQREDREILRAGLFMAASLGVFLLILLVLSKDTGLFVSEIEYMARFRDISGLSEGAPVRLGGLTVGRVTKISFSDNFKDNYVQVKFVVEEQYKRRIREDSVVTIETQGLLGDKYLSITPGSPSAHVVTEGTVLRSREAVDIGKALARTESIIEDTAAIVNSLRGAFAGLDENTFKNIAEGARGIKQFADAVSNKDGLVGRLLYSKKDADIILGKLHSVLNSIDNITQAIKKDEGLLHALIYDARGKRLLTDLDEMARSVKYASDNISAISNELRERRSILHQLVFENSAGIREKIEDSIDKINQSAESIKEIATALSRGKGTLGALLMDSKLYDNLVEVTGVAKRSMILRYAIKKALKYKEAK